MKDKEDLKKIVSERVKKAIVDSCAAKEKEKVEEAAKKA